MTRCAHTRKTRDEKGYVSCRDCNASLAPDKPIWTCKVCNMGINGYRCWQCGQTETDQR